jgi:outer membrane lipase/esterase
VDRVAVNSYEAGAYASYGDTQGYINANASYIWHSFDTYRQVFGSDTKGQFDGGTLSACLELGRVYEADGWRLQPVAALSFASLSTDGYTENGTSLSRLVVKDSGFDSLKSLLGGRIAYPVEMESGRRWVPEVRVSWSHEFMDNSAEFDARLISFAEDPASYFTTKGAEYDRDSVNLGTGMNAPINDKIIVYVDYDASLSSDQTSQTASAGLRVLW